MDRAHRIAWDCSFKWWQIQRNANAKSSTAFPPNLPSLIHTCCCFLIYDVVGEGLENNHACILYLCSGILSIYLQIKALLKVDFGSRSQSWVPDFYSTFVKKSTLKSTLLDFKSGKSDLDSTPPRWSDPYPKPYFYTISFSWSSWKMGFNLCLKVTSLYADGRSTLSTNPCAMKTTFSQ